MKKLFIIITLLITVSCRNHAPPPMIAHPLNDTDSPWELIQKSAQFNIPLNKKIANEQKRLLANKSSFQQLAVRSEPYMYYIIDQLKKRTMPVELAIIPMMESAYNPKATSTAKAAGLWQMVPKTAEAFGMVANHWYDARRDLIASTDAALNYLQYLNGLFDGDWLLTIAAYNAGEGRIKRAQRWNKKHHLPTHFWALNLPKQTMLYVPKFLAIVDIIKNYSQYGITLPQKQDANALIQIHIGKKVDLKTLSQFTDLSLDELATYNAAYLKKQLNDPYHLFIPTHQAQQLYDNLIQNNYSNSRIIDLLSLPGKQHYSNELYNINVTNNKYLSVTDVDLQFYAKEHIRHRQIIYHVKLGDNLSRIAKNYNIPMNKLLQWNNMKDANNLKIGEKLVINLSS